MTPNTFAILLIRAMAAQLSIAGAILLGVELAFQLARKPGPRLDNAYFVVTAFHAQLITALLCFALAGVLLLGSRTFARWLSVGL